MKEEEAAAKKGDEGLDIALLETRRKRKVQSTEPGCSQSAEQRRQETMQPSRLQSLRSLPRNLIEPNLLVSLFSTVPPPPPPLCSDYVRRVAEASVVCACNIHACMYNVHEGGSRSRKGEGERETAEYDDL